MDETEGIRREMVQSINIGLEREEMEALHGKVFNTDEVAQEFSIEGFMAPFCLGKEKETGRKVLLMFQHDPRFYWVDSYPN